MRCIALFSSCQCRSSCDPSGVSSHSLHDTYMDRKRFYIFANLLGRSCNKSCCASVTRRVVCHRDIIVDSLWNSHHFDILILTDFINMTACIHGSVSTIQKDIFNVMFLKDIHHLLIIFFIKRIS